MKTKDPDVLALKKACKALEQSSSTRMLIVNLRFLYDRYITNPPPKAWWSNPTARRPE